MEEEKYITLLKKSDETSAGIRDPAIHGYVSTVIANQLGRLFATQRWWKSWRPMYFLPCGKTGASFPAGICGDGWRRWQETRRKDYIRGQKIPWETLEEDTCFSTGLFDALEKEEQRAVLDAALRAIRPKEREIILRYYYYNQTVSQIARDMKLNHETAKSRLQRGRKKLKDILQKGGYFA